MMSHGSLTLQSRMKCLGLVVYTRTKNSKNAREIES